jgi:hypothetical protein
VAAMAPVVMREGAMGERRGATGGDWGAGGWMSIGVGARKKEQRDDAGERTMRVGTGGRRAEACGGAGPSGGAGMAAAWEGRRWRYSGDDGSVEERRGPGAGCGCAGQGAERQGQKWNGVGANARGWEADSRHTGKSRNKFLSPLRTF